mmetsp:Transcript_19304/g.42821  ORF Transcript_19304/g.42821 Transcript_19304/m.42821 type:complete len:87 (+) Transcript_19304:289-549(+)
MCVQLDTVESSSLGVASQECRHRLRPDYDATASAGYWDVRLCVKLDAVEGRSPGVANHLAEVQLHLGAMAQLESEWGNGVIFRYAT